MNKVLFLYTDWSQNEYRMKNKAYGGVSYYRIFKPAEYLKKIYNYDIDVLGQEIPEMAKSYTDHAQFWVDLVSKYQLVFMKPVDHAPTLGAIIFACTYAKIPLVIDFDDNLFEIKKDQPGYAHYYPGSQKRAILGAAISMADYITVSTMPLKKYYFNRTKKVQKEKQDITILPNCNDIKDFDYKHTKRDQKKVVIGWQGSTTHFADLRIVIPVLGKLLQKYPNLYIEFLGGIEEAKIKELFIDVPENVLERISIKAGCPAWDKYPELLSKQPWDIGIAPLVDDEFCRGKSHIKWLEYAMYLIPTVASRTYPYYKKIQGVKTIVDGKTGYLCKNQNDWEKKLTWLIEDKKLRSKIAVAAYDYVYKNWQYGDQIHKWHEFIQYAIKKGKTKNFPINQ